MGHDVGRRELRRANVSYQAPAIEQRVAVSAPLNTVAGPSNPTVDRSPRWRTEPTDDGEREA